MRLRQTATVVTLFLAFILILLTVFLPANRTTTTTTTTTTMNAADDVREKDDDDSPSAAKKSAISTIELLRYFEFNDSTTAGLVTWAHAVNSKSKFNDAVAAGINFFEADVLLRGGGGIGGGGSPIMAHPPATDSDLTLKNFLEMSSNLRVGIKLDFKTIEALRGSIDVLTDYQRLWEDERESTLEREGRLTKPPLWMNADIVGHDLVSRGKMDADDFLNLTRHVTPDATLSVGWNIAAEYFNSVGALEAPVTALPLFGLGAAAGATPTTTRSNSFAYFDADVQRMHDALTRNGVLSSASITFAIWSKFIPGSQRTLRWLTDQFPRSSVTVWGKAGDASAEDVKRIYNVLTISRVFLDLPEELRKELLSS